ncbi:MAG: RIP metalloprotease RseP [Sphingobacteriaceae bacterium]|nr:RIP metalloprotease RseP [Sphingobacteriaceae bacterium]
MDVLIMAGQLLLGLSILVILHELGHFLAARAFGIKVEKFYLFFDAWGFKLFSFKKGGVEYGVGWLPLGGYVKIAGMIDESMDKEQLAQPIQDWEFRAKPAWQRLIVMLGGIIVNIIVGIVIFWFITFKYGESFVLNDSLKHGILPGEVGKEIGLKAGDRLLAINGKRVKYFDEILSPTIFLSTDATITVSRDNKTLNIKIPNNVIDMLGKYGKNEFVSYRLKSSIDSVLPEKGAQFAGLKKGDEIIKINHKTALYNDQAMVILKANKGKKVDFEVLRENKPLNLKVQIDTAGTIGIAFSSKELKSEVINYNFFESFSIGVNKAWTSFTSNAKGISKMISGDASARNISSPIGIAKVYGSTFSWYKFWSLTGLISIALAFMNLLPIPALDGGHVVFLLLEIIKGKPVSDKVLEKAQIVGFVILMALMVFSFGNDILKIFGL